MQQYHSMFGVHGGVGGAGLGQPYYRAMCEAGGTVVHKSTNDAGQAMEAALVARDYPDRLHAIVMRWTNPGPPGADNDHDVPDYSNEPRAEAEAFMARIEHNVINAPELDPLRDLIYLQIGNELRTQPDPNAPNWNDQHPMDWLAVWGRRCAEIALTWGFRVVLFGMNAGTPEPADWRRPAMLALLRWIEAMGRDHIVIGLNEGCHDMLGNGLDFRTTPAADYAPWWIGRGGFCVEAARQNGIRPPRFIATEWAWNLRDMPYHDKALEDIEHVVPLYREIGYIGAALWATHTSAHTGGLRDRMMAFLPSLRNFNLERVWDEVGAPPPVITPPPLGTPRVDYERTYWLLPPGAPQSWWTAIIFGAGTEQRPTIGGSADDAGIGALSKRTVMAVRPDKWTPPLTQGWFDMHYPGAEMVAVSVRNADDLQAYVQRYYYGTSDTAVGVDVSHHQPPHLIDYRAAARDITFAYIKASELTTPDPAFAEHTARFQGQGVLVGAYHFLNPRGTGAEQARVFAELCAGADLDLPPALDVEKHSIHNEWPTCTQVRDFVDAWRTLTGGAPLMIYTSRGQWAAICRASDECRGMCEDEAFAARHEMWVADWTHGAQEPVLPSPWRNWRLWQQRDNATISGMPDVVDQNVFNGTVAELHAWSERYRRHVDEPQLRAVVGVHDAAGGDWMRDNSVEGYCVVPVAVGTEIQTLDYTRLAQAGINVIARLNYGYHPTGTLPAAGVERVLFINACQETIRKARGVWGFVIGNECNNINEQPGGEAYTLTPRYYAGIYNRIWDAVQAQARLSPAAVDPYHPIDGGQWWYDTLRAISGAHFLTYHPKTQRPDPALIDSDARFGDQPLRYQYMNFKAYQPLMARVPRHMRTAQTILTEVNPHPDWGLRPAEWWRAMMAHVDAWNGGARGDLPAIDGVVAYRWQSGNEGDFSIYNRPGLLDAIRESAVR